MYDRVFNYNCKHWTKRGGLEHGSSIKSNTFSYRYLKDIWMDNINVCIDLYYLVNGLILVFSCTILIYNYLVIKSFVFYKIFR